MLRAFRHYNFKLYMTGESIGLTGMWIYQAALLWLTWRLTHSAVWLGVIGFTSHIPILFLGLLGGVLADRLDRLQLLRHLQLLMVASMLLLALLVLWGKALLWHLIILSTVYGVFRAFEQPTRHTLLMDMVGRESLLNAVSLNAAMFHSTRMLGPVIAGFLIDWKGEGSCFLISSVALLALFITLNVMRRSELHPSHRNHLSATAAIKEVILFALREPRIHLPLAMLAVVGGVLFSFLPLLPIFADVIYDKGAVEFGWLLGANGIGACLGALVMARHAPKTDLLTISTRSLVISSLFLFAFSQVSILWLGLFFLFCFGFSLSFLFTSTATHLQREAPEHLRGRMMSLYTTTFLGLMPVSSIMGGLLAESLGAPLTLTLAAGTAFLAGSIGTRFSLKERLP